MTNRLIAVLLAIAMGACSNAPVGPPVQSTAKTSDNHAPPDRPAGSAQPAAQSDPATTETDPENPLPSPEELSPVAVIAKAVLVLSLIAMTVLIYLPYVWVK